MTRTLATLLTVMLLAAPAAAQSAPPAPQLDMRRVYQVVGRFYGLDPDLLAAIARVESNNDPRAVSPKGAQGLMQLMPATAQRFAVNDPFDPIENVLGAARFLAYLRSESQIGAPFAVNLPEMLAAYNAGPAAVAKYQGVPPYAETRAYVRKVLWAYLLDENPPPSLPDGGGRGPAPSVHLAHRRAARTRSRHGDVTALDQLAEIQRERANALHGQQSPAAH